MDIGVNILYPLYRLYRLCSRRGCRGLVMVAVVGVGRMGTVLEDWHRPVRVPVRVGTDLQAPLLLPGRALQANGKACFRRRLVRDRLLVERRVWGLWGLDRVQARVRVARVESDQLMPIRSRISSDVGTRKRHLPNRKLHQGLNRSRIRIHIHSRIR